MTNLDFRLRHLYRKVAGLRLHVLLQFKQDLAAVERLGFQLSSMAGDVAAGSISFDRLDELKNHPEVIIVEGSHSLKRELDVSLVASNLIDVGTEERLIPSLGNGAIIGIIDAGFDLSHPCFCDDEGKTRILAAWDQVNMEKAVGEPPCGFVYGIEYTQDTINQQILEQKILVTKNPLGNGHGSVVAGVAAGNGLPEKVFTGIATNAELIFVNYNNDRPIGGSAFLLDAIRYIIDFAHKCRKPVVINISMGDNLGAHDGKSLLERAIDNIAEQEGVLIVNSAGNETDGRRHARGQVRQDQEHELLFELRQSEATTVNEDTIDLWYQSEDRFTVCVKTPAGWTSPHIEPDTEQVLTFPNGTQAYICSQTDYPTNHANRISLILDEGGPWENGVWKLVLYGNAVKREGRFDAWTDRPSGVSGISFPQAATNDGNVTLPGTAKQVFTVGAFVSRPAKGLQPKALKGTLGPLSSHGPTLDGRTKPDVTAPGFFVIGPGTRKAVSGPNFSNYGFRTGTSISAPHVTGVAALFLSLNPALTAGQIADALRSTASKDRFTGNVPNDIWGHGKLNAAAAYKALFSSTSKEAKTMEAKTTSERVQEIRFSIPNQDKSARSDIVIRFVTNEQGGLIRIEGDGPLHGYEGRLTLKGQSLDGGTQCVVCSGKGGDCTVEVPCKSCE